MLYIRDQGGHGTVVRNLKKELEKRGHQVDLLSREDHFKVYSFSPIVIREAVGKIEKRYDIIYTHDWSLALSLLFPLPMCWKKHYCLFHGHQPNKLRFLQSIIGKCMGKKLFVVGDTLKERFPKSTLVYNGVDFDTFKDLKKKRKYLGWIKRDYDLITEEEVRALGKEMELPVLLADHIPYEKMNEFYNKCKVFVSYPPDYTGFNLAWIEAMAAGVPEVIGNENGIGVDNAVKNYKDFTWKKNVDKLLEVWNGR